MASKVRLSDQIRKAIDRSDMSKYAICKAAEIDQSVMSRFMARKAGMTLESLDRLAAVLDLRIVSGRKARRKAR